MSTPSRNPLGDFRKECKLVLRNTLEGVLPNNTVSSQEIRKKMLSNSLEIPSSINFGDLATSICFEIAKEVELTPKRLAEKIVDNIDLSKVFLLKATKAMKGYVNFYVDNLRLSRLTLDSARFFNESYGYIKVDTPQKVIVEHTSANPAGPVHVGTARNSILGDSISHLLKARGHEISTHFYVDDVGRQIAVLAYGYNLLNKRKPIGKTDHWVGLVYAITSCIVEIEKLKIKLKKLEKNHELYQQANKVRLDLDDWVFAAADLQERNTDLFENILEGIKKDENPEKSIAMIMKSYERNDPKIRTLVREVVKLCLDGFKETYNKVGISWDSWDWESDLVWSGAVFDVMNRLQKTPYCISKEGVIIFDVNTTSKRMQLKKLLGVHKNYDIPPLVLARSDGTTLYSTRDIAYSLKKLSQADKVINVIGTEQAIPQLQIRIALSILASLKAAENLIHYPHELVRMPGYKMSKRRGRYLTFDDILTESIKRALKEVEKRSPDLPNKLKKKISKAVGIGAVKYALIDVSPSKQVIFTWDKVLNFEMNSAPFIQYAYARACNILKKIEEKGINPDYSLLNETIEFEMVKKIGLFPEIFISAADNLNPGLLSEYAYNLAAKFNSFYAKIPVLKAKPIALRDARLAIVDSVRITLKNTLNLLGIETLERM